MLCRSRAAWYTLLLVTAGTAGGIYAIHRSQQTERQVNILSLQHGCPRLESGGAERAWVVQNLHKGVLRDQELYRLKKAQHTLANAQNRDSTSD